MNLSAYDFDAQRGFLPATDPLESLPHPFGEWECLGQNLPKLLVAGQLRSRPDRMIPWRLGALAAILEHARSACCPREARERA